MDNIMSKLNEAYKLISTLSVSGDAVDVVAVVRNHLREAYKKLEEKKEMMANESTEAAVRERDSEDTAAAV